MQLIRTWRIGPLSATLFITFLALALAKPLPLTVFAQSSAPVEQGKFILHKFEQPIGEETYQITRDGDALSAKIDFKFTDRSTAVPLTAAFSSASDLTPLAFEIKGKNSRLTDIDEAVEVQSEKIRLRDRDKWTETTKPPQFFTIAGYAPTTMQMLMVRYWATHGSPAQLATLPTGKVKIEPRGTDAVRVDGKDQKLDRFTIEGLIWGRETLWFDAKRNLVAAVTTDAEFDHFEAIREGYESGLGTFVGLAGSDGMAALAEISKGISGSRAEKIALVGGTLIDGTGRDPVPDSVVVIEKGRIVDAGPKSRVKIPSGAQKVDARGKTILPGLWDMHAHFEQVEWGPIYLAAGATTVRDCGNEFEFIVAVRDAIRNGRGLGPRLLLAGLVDGTSPRALGIQRVDSPADAHAWVNRYNDAGFQQMKIYSSMTLENVTAVATEAHMLGMTVTGHVPNSMNLFQAVGAGMDQINHLHYVVVEMMPEGTQSASLTRVQVAERVAGIDVSSPQAIKVIDFLKAHSIVVDPTVALTELGTASPARPFESFEPGTMKVAPELAAQYVIPTRGEPIKQARIAALQRDLQIIGALHAAGVPIVAGTDQGVPGYSLYREIELYVDAEFTPMEAIKAATIVPARVMGLDSELGTVEPGKKADLIVLGANPLDSIHNIRTVEKVVSGGTLYDSAPLWKSVGFKP